MSSQLYGYLREWSRERVGLEWKIADHCVLMQKLQELEDKGEDWKILAEKQQMERAREKRK